jgi:SRSO17 transposase
METNNTKLSFLLTFHFHGFTVELMKKQQLKSLDRRLSQFLRDLLEPMGRSERRHWARVYLQGLLLDGDRKSIEPIAERIPGADVQALRQFVGQSPWAVHDIQRRLAKKVINLFSGTEVWTVDETSFPKAGKYSVGVSRQYCGALGKVANCQVAVTLHWSSDECSCPIGWELYIPKEWFEDPGRAAKAKIPAGTVFRKKSELALKLICQAIDWGLPARPVVADSLYGDDFHFRQQLRERGIFYAVQVEPATVVWEKDPNDVAVPPQRTGRPGKYTPLAMLPKPGNLASVALELPEDSWRQIEWREGTKGPQRSRFALVRVWAAHGWDKPGHGERVPELLLIEWPEGRETPTKYWLAWFGPESVEDILEVVRIAKARWRIELDYREMKEELGLDHYEGRHWLGWYHHVTLVTIAYAFLRAEQARSKKNFWCDLASGEEVTANGAD